MVDGVPASVLHGLMARGAPFMRHQDVLAKLAG